MIFTDTSLPWTGAPVRHSSNLHAYLGERLPSSWSRYLPSSITLFIDPAIDDGAVTNFLTNMAAQLRYELERRMTRQAKFLRLGLLSEAELEAFLTHRTAAQAWAIYYSDDGGLGDLTRVDEATTTSFRGVIPCSTMQNHGVAWEQDGDGKLKTWLATSRREGAAWDWDSDIGHESAHAAFAQVPLFVQSSPQIPNNALSANDHTDEISSTQIAQLMYLYSEIAVVAVRGEPRATQTGLPVALHSELEALLRISARLSGDSAISEAAGICAGIKGQFDVDTGDELFYVAASIMRHIPHLTRFIDNPFPPTQLQFQAALRQVGPNS